MLDVAQDNNNNNLKKDSFSMDRLLTNRGSMTRGTGVGVGYRKSRVNFKNSIFSKRESVSFNYNSDNKRLSKKLSFMDNNLSNDYIYSDDSDSEFNNNMNNKRTSRRFNAKFRANDSRFVNLVDVIKPVYKNSNSTTTLTGEDEIKDIAKIIEQNEALKTSEEKEKERMKKSKINGSKLALSARQMLAASGYLYANY